MALRFDDDDWLDDETTSSPRALNYAGARVIQKKRCEGSLDLAYAKWGRRPMTRRRDVRRYKNAA